MSIIKIPMSIRKAVTVEYIAAVYGMHGTGPAGDIDNDYIKSVKERIAHKMSLPAGSKITGIRSPEIKEAVVELSDCRTGGHGYWCGCSNPLKLQG